MSTKTNNPTPVDVTKITKGTASLRTMNAPGMAWHGQHEVNCGIDHECIAEVVHSEHDGHLIAEAFNVANETGLSPRQMKERLDEAVRAIERLKGQVELCDYRDGPHHDLKMNAAYLDLITLKLIEP